MARLNLDLTDLPFKIRSRRNEVLKHEAYEDELMVLDKASHVFAFHPMEHFELLHHILHIFLKLRYQLRACK